MNQLAKFEHLKYLISNIDARNINLEVWQGNTPCGTYACVGGHACMDADFNKQGLSLRNNEPHFNGFTGYDALQHFFEIDSSTTSIVFNPKWYDEYDPDKIKDEIITHINYVIKEVSGLRKTKFR